MTEDQLRAIYLKAVGVVLEDRLIPATRKFIDALFDTLEPAGYLDPDGTMHAEEWEADADCEEVFRRPA